MKTNRYILSKATFSSGSGMPIAFALNLAILPLFAHYLQTNPVEAAITIGVIYTSVSIFRRFIIDWIEEKYGLNIRPDYLIRKLLNLNK